jgi:hypothetical protein
MADYDVVEEAILAEQGSRIERRRAARFLEVLREQERAARPHGELSAHAKASVAAFERDVAALNRLVDDERDTLIREPAPLFDIGSMPVGDRTLKVFGAGLCTLSWAHIDDAPVGHARTDPDTGSFSADNYTTGPVRFTVAQMGISYRPSAAICKLSVRAYVNYSGYYMLQHRVHDDSIPETRWAWALGSVGLKVDSVKPDGSSYHLDAETWVNPWDVARPNPTEVRDVEGSASVLDGMIVEPIAVSSRNYAVWATCRVGVSADPGFAVSTYATSSIGCQLVLGVVEEIENW